MTGWRKTLEVWVPLLVIGGTFAAVQFLWSNLVGFELVDIVSSVSSMTAGVVVIRFWQPARVWRFDHEAEGITGATGDPSASSAIGQRPRSGLTDTVAGWRGPGCPSRC